MTDQTASISSQSIIDIAEFARLGKSCEGEIGVRDLPRLQDMIVPGEQRLHFHLQGSLSPRREPRIACIIRGHLSLRCERCLGVFEHRLELLSTVVFVTDESLLPAIEDEEAAIDYVVGETTLNVRTLIEDEIILALPLVPRHETGECQASAEEVADYDKPLPFATLAKLRRE